MRPYHLGVNNLSDDMDNENVKEPWMDFCLCKHFAVHVLHMPWTALWESSSSLAMVTGTESSGRSWYCCWRCSQAPCLSWKWAENICQVNLPWESFNLILCLWNVSWFGLISWYIPIKTYIHIESNMHIIECHLLQTKRYTIVLWTNQGRVESIAISQGFEIIKFCQPRTDRGEWQIAAECQKFPGQLFVCSDKQSCEFLETSS